MKSTRGDRLREARKAAGYKSGAEAAKSLGVPPATFNAHERAESPGGRDYGPDEAAKYAAKFKVDDAWLLTGKGKAPAHQAKFAPDAGIENVLTSLGGHIDSSSMLYEENDGYRPTVPLVGYVRAGAEAVFLPLLESELDRVPAPPGANDNTHALEIRGVSLGELFDRWLVYFDDVRSPVTPDLIGKLCVVGVSDGRILVKKLRRGRDGLYDLLSNTEPPIEGVVIDWAAKVKSMEPQ